MVLPELRALANQAGVKGTSGMRKNELIAAIQESRGQANGVSAADAPSAQDQRQIRSSAKLPKRRPPKGNRTIQQRAEAPRRERRGASREAGSATRTADEADRERPRHPRERQGHGEADSRQGGRQHAKTDERGQDAGSDQSGGPARLGRPAGSRRPRRRRRRPSRPAGRRFRDRRRRGERSGEGGRRPNCARTTSSSR